ncbi:unnamed protein product, partial [Owenia fusiformis]
ESNWIRTRVPELLNTNIFNKDIGVTVTSVYVYIMAPLLILMLGVAVFSDVEAYGRGYLDVIFSSKNYPAYILDVNSNGLGYIIVANAANPNMWVIEQPGLTGEEGTVSLTYKGKPGFYLRHTGFLMQIDNKYDPVVPQHFLLDATFRIRNDKYFPGYLAFESVNYPGRFIRHQGYRLKLHPSDGSELFKNDASF